MRLVPMEGNRFTLSAEEAVKRCDENTIGVVAILGSTFDGAYEPVKEICAALDDLAGAHRARHPGARRRRLGRVRRAVPRPGSGVGLPAAAGGLDQRLGPQVRAGVPGRRLGRVARRRGAARGPDLLGQLPGRQHADVRAQLLAARARRWSRSTTTSCGSGSRATRRCSGYAREVATRLSGEIEKLRPVRAADPRRRSCRCSPSSCATRSTTTPCSTSPVRCASAAGRCRPTRSPKNRTDLAALRVVVRRGFTHDLADMLLADLNRVLPRLAEPTDPGAHRGREQLPSLNDSPGGSMKRTDAFVVFGITGRSGPGDDPALPLPAGGARSPVVSDHRRGSRRLDGRAPARACSHRDRSNRSDH